MIFQTHETFRCTGQNVILYPISHVLFFLFCFFFVFFNSLGMRAKRKRKKKRAKRRKRRRKKRRKGKEEIRPHQSQMRAGRGSFISLCSPETEQNNSNTSISKLYSVVTGFYFIKIHSKCVPPPVFWPNQQTLSKPFLSHH